MRRIAFFILAVMCLLVQACKKEPLPGSNTITVSVVGTFNEMNGETKATLARIVRIKWSTSDLVFAFGGKEYLGTLSVTKVTDGESVAYISGTIKAPEDQSINSITLIYSNLVTPSSFVVGSKYDSFVMSLENQSIAQAPILTTAPLHYTPGATVISETKMGFDYVTSTYVVSCYSLHPSTAIQCVTLSDVATECVLSLSDTKPYYSTVQSENIGTIVWTPKAGAKANSQGETTVQLGVALTPNNGSKRTITVYQNGYIGVDNTFDGLEFAAGSFYSTICGFDTSEAYSGGIDKYYPITWTW